jgi:hypothetical protein
MIRALTANISKMKSSADLSDARRRALVCPAANYRQCHQRRLGGRAILTGFSEGTGGGNLYFRSHKSNIRRGGTYFLNPPLLEDRGVSFVRTEIKMNCRGYGCAALMRGMGRAGRTCQNLTLRRDTRARGDGVLGRAPGISASGSHPP